MIFHTRKLFMCLLAACILLPVGAVAQSAAWNDRWHFGVAGGFRTSHMRFSDIDESYFPTNKNLNGGVFSLFVQGEFGKQRQFGIRPQLSFLRRGGKLTEINEKIYDAAGIEDLYYRLSAKYVDVRVPLIYNFMKAESGIRPYVYFAPVLGFATGGTIKMQADFEDNSYLGYQMDASKANLAAAYFAGQLGAGVKFAVPVADKKCYVGIEASYEIGFTDTYGKKEKDGEAIDVAQLFTRNYKINGTRKFSGFELQATLSVPFSIFKARKPAASQPVPVAVVEREVIPAKPARKKEKPCYTLEEVIDLMARGENVEGKTICAVDAINFEFAKSNIQRESYEYLDKLATTLARTNKRIEVKGHTDNVGSDEFNMNLSRERAEAVVEYLVKKGVNRNKLTYSFYGKSRPLMSNDTEEGRAMNRRVEFTILNDF